MLLALFFVLGLFAIAVVTSVGAAVYCEHLKAVWKEANETVTYPGCQEYDRWVAQLPESGWPSNGFVTMQAMMAGVWLSFVFWLCVCCDHRSVSTTSTTCQIKPVYKAERLCTCGHIVQLKRSNLTVGV
ncbi:uncharacterized protein LOC134195811 isoform X2 [Corticium candelabrum]|nr:uncharacterized protein LOC134195811 isoform X2 [Corticium candelabrum]